jgi:simple sugar transport system permease protein
MMEKRKNINIGKFNFLRLNSIATFLVYIVMIIVFIITAPQAFLHYRIYMSFLSIIPFSLIMALGLTFLVIAGEIDLSFPGVMVISSFVFAYIFNSTGSSILALIMGLSTGIIAGFLNGIIVTKFKIPSIVVTLAMQFIWQGLALVLSQANQITLGVLREFLLFKVLVGKIGGVFPAQSLWALALAIFLGILLNRHYFGEKILFIGDNSEAARMMGINVNWTIVQAFMLMGLLSSFSSILLSLELSGWWPTFGPGYLLIVIAAVFIGGTSIYGGEGTILGTTIGAFIIGSMTAGIVAAGVQEFWTKFVQGIVLLVAVIINTFLNKRKGF